MRSVKFESAAEEAKWVNRIMEKNGDEIVSPGVYNIVETDCDGRYEYAVGRVQVNQDIKMRDLALGLYHKHKYMSSWIYLKLRQISNDEPFIVL